MPAPYPLEFRREAVELLKRSGKSMPELARELASPMALAITDRRLLSLGLGATPGMGMGGEVKTFVSEAPLEAVDTIEIKRLSWARSSRSRSEGGEFKLEAGAGANAKGVVEAFEQRRGAAV